MSNRYLTILSSIVLAGLLFSSCNSSKDLTNKKLKSENNQSNLPTDIVGMVNGKKITFNQLMSYYKQNANVDSTTKNQRFQKLSKFLNLYLTYRAKLSAAKEAGYFRNALLLHEYHQYENQYAYKYWFDHKIKKELFNQLYQRSDSEIDVSQIVIRLPLNAPPKDTLKVWNKLVKARKKFEAGTPFSELVKEYSTRQHNKPIGGNMGYISAGMVVKPFEDAAFSTPVGKVSMPIRTRYGYRLIYVMGKRKAIPDREIAHIVLLTRGKGKSVSSASKKAKTIYKELQNGKSWRKLVIKYSDDIRSRYTGGKMGWLNRDRYHSKLIDKIFSLPKAGTYTHPVKIGSSIQIIRLDSIRTFKNTGQKKQYIMQLLKHLPRYKNYKEEVLNRVRKLGQANVINQNYSFLKSIMTKQDTVDWNSLTLSTDELQKTLYIINGRKYKVRNFIKWMKKKDMTPKAFKNHRDLFQKFQKFANEQQLTPLTARQFPAFANTAHKYLDGLVIYQIAQDSVWNYAAKDTSALKRLYREHPKNYYYSKRYCYYGIAANRDTLLHQALTLIKEGTSPDSLKNKFKSHIEVFRDSTSAENGGIFYKKLKSLHIGEFSKPFTYHYKRTMLHLSNILKPQKMTFKQAQNKLVSNFQQIRKKEWEKALKKRYHVVAYPQNLKKSLEKFNH